MFNSGVCLFFPSEVPYLQGGVDKRVNGRGNNVSIISYRSQLRVYSHTRYLAIIILKIYTNNGCNILGKYTKKEHLVSLGTL